MSKLTKNKKNALSKFDNNKQYPLAEAAKIVKDITFTKFDASVELHIRLGIDTSKSDQMIRGVVTLPHGTGKQTRILALCTPEKEDEAKQAGADHVGLEDYIEKIEKGWTDIDVIVTEPSVMAKVGKLGKILGPRNLMPNPKSGTVTQDIGKAVKEVKSGKIDFRVDKSGIIHSGIGKISFSPDKIAENASEVIQEVSKLKPPSAKGNYLKSIFISSSMSPGIAIDVNTLEQ